VTTLVLDSGGVSALATQRARLLELRRRQAWPAKVPSVVLVESLTGDHRRDTAPNRLLKMCQISDVTGLIAREAARLRGATGRAGSISATDAVVVAFASTCDAPVILTSDPKDIGALADHARKPILVSAT
jgi:predicted nucleic acid-binding protein